MKKTFCLILAMILGIALLPAQVVRIHQAPKPAKEVLNDSLCSPLFRTFNETVFDLENENPDAIAYRNIIDWLQGRVAGLQVSWQRGIPVPYIRGGAAACFLDEIPVDAGLLENISIADIALVKVIKPPFIGAFGGGGNGAIAVYTRR